MGEKRLALLNQRSRLVQVVFSASVEYGCWLLVVGCWVFVGRCLLFVFRIFVLEMVGNYFAGFEIFFATEQHDGCADLFAEFDEFFYG